MRTRTGLTYVFAEGPSRWRVGSWARCLMHRGRIRRYAAELDLGGLHSAVRVQHPDLQAFPRDPCAAVPSGHDV